MPVGFRVRPGAAGFRPRHAAGPWHRSAEAPYSAFAGRARAPAAATLPRVRASVRTRLACLLLSLAAGCGARTSLDGLDPGSGMDGGRDAGPDAGEAPDGGLDGGGDGGRPDAGPIPDGGCVPVEDGCLGDEVCGDGDDDDCDGQVDEGCACEPGAVQDCFAGPPGRRRVGACQDGQQVCGVAGGWGPCQGGVQPDESVCTGRDDLCNGCSADRICMIDCPSPGDPRVPDGAPFEPYLLDGRAFYAGPAEGFRWSVEGGPCDRLAPRLESFTLTGAASERATFTPRLSGDYRVTLSVTVPGGEVLSCAWVVHVAGPGLRVEMCYPESESEDLDLFLHRPDDTTPWYASGGTAFDALPEASCGWHDCEAEVRQAAHPVTGGPVSRADWGYADSPLAQCEQGPNGDRFRALLGVCPNPRLDIDNNLSPGRSGLPENINVDNPRDGETFRVMVQNFTGGTAQPVVNVYCGGRRVATFGERPDVVNNFRGPNGNTAIGTMWRVADVTVHVDAAGETTGCDVELLHRPGLTTGFYLTQNDPTF